MGNDTPAKAASMFDDLARNWDTDYRIERARAVADEIRIWVPIGGRARMLEFGSGTGLVGLNLAGDVGSLTFIDSSSGMREVLREKIRLLDLGRKCVVEDDLFSAELELGGYECIVGSMALHHTADVDGAARRFFDLLAAGGRVCIVDLTSDDGAYHRNEPDFDGHHGFDPERLSAQFGGIGFKERYRTVFFSDTRMIAGRYVDYSLFILVMEREGGDGFRTLEYSRAK